MSKVSVVMPTYNSADYLAESISSVLAQTYQDFELIIVDNASTDDSVEIAKSYNDPRIKIYQNKENMGVLYSRNRALEVAEGDYIAFNDSDDLSLPQRFSKQVDFFEKNPEVGLLGTAFLNFYDDGSKADNVTRLELKDADIRAAFYFQNHLSHSNVMIRASVVREHNIKYVYPYCEDYKLWLDIIEHTEVACLPDVLLKYRIRGNSLLAEKKAEYIAAHDQISRMHLTAIMPDATEEEVKLNQLLRIGEKGKFAMPQMLSFVEKLLTFNEEKKIYEKRAFGKVMVKHFYKRFKNLDKKERRQYQQDVFKLFKDFLPIFLKIKIFLRAI